MVGRLIDVGGTRVHVDVRGEPDAPALLYVHGGPGHGSYDFMSAQGDRLADRLLVVGVDQRGVLRSDRLPRHPPLTVDLLVADFEAVRRALEVPSWVIVGHSAGAMYAARYALAHPAAVRAVIFDCPGLDCDLTDRYRLPVIAELLERAGLPERAAEARALAGKTGRIGSVDGSMTLFQLVQDRGRMFFASEEGHARFEALWAAGGFTDEQLAQGAAHAPLIEAMYDDGLGLLEHIARPTMLTHGRADLVAAPEMISRYRALASDGRVQTFTGSGHFAFLEQPVDYARVVLDFVDGLNRA